MAVFTELPAKRASPQSPMLPGMPAEVSGGRAPVRAHLALDTGRTWALSAHLYALGVDPIWPVDLDAIEQDDPVIARIGTAADLEIPLTAFHAAGARLIAIVVDDSDEALIAAVVAGAWAAVAEGDAHVDLAGAVRDVSEGRCPLLSALSSRTGAASAVLTMLREARSRPTVPGRPSPLKDSETRMLRLVSEGLTNQEIAQRIGRSEQTVKNNLSRMFEKIGTRSRVRATTMALEFGWLLEE